MHASIANTSTGQLDNDLLPRDLSYIHNAMIKKISTINNENFRRFSQAEVFNNFLYDRVIANRGGELKRNYWLRLMKNFTYIVWFLLYKKVTYIEEITNDTHELAGSEIKYGTVQIHEFCNFGCPKKRFYYLGIWDAWKRDMRVMGKTQILTKVNFIMKYVMNWIGVLGSNSRRIGWFTPVDILTEYYIYYIITTMSYKDLRLLVVTMVSEGEAWELNLQREIQLIGINTHFNYIVRNPINLGTYGGLLGALMLGSKSSHAVHLEYPYKTIKAYYRKYIQDGILIYEKSEAVEPPKLKVPGIEYRKSYCLEFLVLPEESIYETLHLTQITILLIEQLRIYSIARGISQIEVRFLVQLHPRAATSKNVKRKVLEISPFNDKGYSIKLAIPAYHKVQTEMTMRIIVFNGTTAVLDCLDQTNMVFVSPLSRSGASRCSLSQFYEGNRTLLIQPTDSDVAVWIEEVAASIFKLLPH